MDQNGTRRVVSSIIVAKGAFNGAGTIVEIPNRPGDPDFRDVRASGDSQGSPG